MKSGGKKSSPLLPLMALEQNRTHICSDDSSSPPDTPRVFKRESRGREVTLSSWRARSSKKKSFAIAAALPFGSAKNNWKEPGG